MKYIKAYDRYFHSNYNILDNEIISKLMKIISNNGKQPGKRSIWFVDFDYYFDKGIFWVLLKYSEKNRMELIKNSRTFEIIINNLKTLLTNNKNVKMVETNFLDHMAPLKIDSNGLSRQKANEYIYEIRCYLNDEAVNILNDEFEFANNTKKYNL